MVSKTKLNDMTVCIIGLGYVGMPLAEAFSKHVRVIGFDINETKLQALREQYPSLELTSNPARIKDADVVIIAVPTPVTESKEPDLEPVESASRIVGKNLKKGAIVVLESTVYPGVTEEIMGPILEEESGLRLGLDFKIGYSPERVNPGDKDHTIDKITKIVSGMDEESANILTDLYGTITTVYKTKDIKTAEAAKVIENIQRDLNIALMNELSIIFQKMGLDTKDVLDAASTKWNFNRYNPGMVGGHCIPVDPYYLVYKAKELGHHPQVILAGRSTNDYMPKHVAMLTIKALNEVKKVIHGSSVLIMGLTFKENVEDTRETPVKELIKELKEFSCILYGYDPFLSEKDILNFDVKLFDKSAIKVDCVIFTVAHEQFKAMGLDSIKRFMKETPILVDVRGIFNKKDAKEKGFYYKTL
jgi:UDP-N-acetyl-D-glucosamine/UDP-N-acetyl-D-galactosamine dehydrogenase